MHSRYLGDYTPTPADHEATMRTLAWLDRVTGVGGELRGTVRAAIAMAKTTADIGRYAHPGAESQFVDALYRNYENGIIKPLHHPRGYPPSGPDRHRNRSTP